MAGDFELALSQIISGHDGGLIAIWDVATGSRLRALSGHHVNTFGLATSPDGSTLASGGQDQTVLLWDPATGQQLLRLTDCKAQVNSVAFSPDGNTLAAADHSGAITICAREVRRSSHHAPRDGVFLTAAADSRPSST